MKTTLRSILPTWGATLALLLLAAGPPAQAEYGSYPDDPAGAEADELGYGGSYSYLRAVDGSVTLIQGSTGTRSQADLHQPLLAGDRLWLSPGARAEVLLSDRNVLRLDGDTEVELTALAASPDAAAGRTDLRLLSGRLQLVVYDDALGEEYPRIDTANATVYVQRPGTYLVTADRDAWTEVAVRQGYAEVLTQRGSLMVRESEQAVIEGREWVQAGVEAAGSWTSLERWGEDLERRAARADVEYVDDSLRYAAAPLADHGSWVSVGHRRAWRPRVAAHWRPYTHGYWSPTPSGLSWVSYEPWGWVPYHYGTWDYVSTHGWIWYPGRVFAPAWVYWYWSPSYVGWCPVGYYTHHYYPRYRHGFRFGLYGWAGGDWGHFAHWNFLPSHRLGHRDQARHVRPSYALRNESRLDRLPRGLITTDTRGVTARELAKPEEALRVLQTRPGRQVASNLPDVTPFVARQELPEDVRGRVLSTRPAQAGVATPLRPGGDDKPILERRPAQRPGAGAIAGRPAVGAVSGSDKPGSREIGSGERGPAVSARPGDWRQRPPSAGPQPVKPGTGRPDREVGSPTLERRPAPRPEPPKADSAGGARIERRPAPRPEPPKADTGGGARIERRPAPRPEPPKGDDGGGARIERRPAPRPEPPKANSGGNVRIERRPAPAPSRSPAVQAPAPQRPSSAPVYRGPVSRTPGSVKSPAPSRSPSVSQRPAPSRSPSVSQRPAPSRSPSVSQRPAPRPSPPSSVRSGGGSGKPSVSRAPRSSPSRGSAGRGASSRSGRSREKGGNGKDGG